MASATWTPCCFRLCSWLMLALVLKGLTRLSEGKPIAQERGESVDMNSCLNASRHLLEAANDAWHRLQNHFSRAFNCTYEDMDIEEVTKKMAATIKGCLANTTLMDGKCGQRSRKPVDQSKCFQGIHDDLMAYKEELKHQPGLSDVINDMLMALNFPANERQTPVTSSLTSRSFSADLRECRVVLALRLRTVTITRIINYLKFLKENKA